MRSIPDATAITLTELERAELESLARSMKGEHRLRLRARIILLASDGAATRQIARTVGCTIGTASKWRVRYAAKRMAGLDDTGERVAARSLNMGRSTMRVFWLRSTRSRLRATPTGLGRC